MLKQTCLASFIIFLSLTASPVHAQKPVVINDALGQTIQISTALYDVVGFATWTLIIRDIDHGINVPYIFDLYRGEQFFVALTYGYDYQILESKLTLVKYKPYYNAYRKFVINNFCHLQTNGRIHHGRSLTVGITGKLSPNTGLYDCHISSFQNDIFTVVEQ